MITITLDNNTITEGISGGSLTLKRAIAGDGQLRFGGCIASMLEFSLYDKNYRGSSVNLSVDNKKLFTGTIDTITETTDEYKFKAYDAFYSLGQMDVMEWYRNLTFPITLANMLTSLLNYAGISYTTYELPQGAMVVDKTVEGQSMALLDVLKAICELNGGFGVINADGAFNIVYLSSVSAYSGLQVLSGFTKDKLVRPIDKVQIRAESEDIGGIYGSGENAYIIQGNFLCYGKSTAELQEIAKTLYDTIAGIAYVPYTAEMVDTDFDLELDGQSVTIESSNDAITTYIMDITMSGGQLSTQKISAYGTEYRDEVVSDVNSELYATQYKVLKISKDVDGIRVIAEDAGSKVSELTYDVDELNVRFEQLQKEVDGSIEVYYTNEEPTLNNYPAIDWNASPLLDVTLFDDNGEMPFLYTDENYRNYARHLVYDQTHSITYRFVNRNGVWGFEVLENSDFSTVLNKVAKLEMTTEGLTTQVETTEQKLENNYWTKETTASQIKQASDNITLDVSKKYATKSDVLAQLVLEIGADNIARISGKAQEILFSGDRFVVDSSNFKLDKTGIITALAGIIGGFTIMKGDNDVYYLQADYGDYRVWIQPPNNADSWVFSIQKKINGTYTSVWRVDANGNEYVNNLNANDITAHDANLNDANAQNVNVADTVNATDIYGTNYIQSNNNITALGNLTAYSNVYANNGTIYGGSVESKANVWANNDGAGLRPAITGSQPAVLIFDASGASVYINNIYMGKLKYS